jgi:hypothetical protein
MAAGSYLGSLAGRDLAARCAQGRLDARGKAASRAARKRALTAGSSSRWAGAITRTSDDLWALAERNLAAERASLRARVRQIQARLVVPAGQQHGRVRGYATQAERWAKQQRLQRLQARAAAAQRRLEHGQVSACRGSRRLARARHNLDAAGLIQAGWRTRWEAERWFLTADGEADKTWGNETIRVHPDEGWLEIKLPAPLAHLANRPHGRYRLSCPVEFSYRGDEVAAQAATGAVRYDISYDPARGRWYLDASWRTAPAPAPAVAELRAAPVLAVDLNYDHLAAWAVTPDGNPAGPPVTIPLALAGLPASQRDGRLRNAISSLIRIAAQRGCRAIVIEDLDFADARDQGRERHGRRPSRGRRGRAFRRLTGGIPTGRFRDRLTQMARNQGLWVIAVDPAYTSAWGRLPERALVQAVKGAAADRAGAGREHQVIEARGRAEEPGHGRVVGRVELGHLDRVAEPLHGRVQPRLGPSGDGDLGARRGERPGGGLSDACAAAHDDDPLSVKGHVVSSICRYWPSRQILPRL